MTKIINGFPPPPEGGAARVTIDGIPLSLPSLNLRYERRHSPTGFAWSYGGSGPAELARALLIALLPKQPIVRHPACYQTFKFDVIAQLPRDGFELSSEVVEAWFANFQRDFTNYLNGWSAAVAEWSPR